MAINTADLFQIGVVRQQTLFAQILLNLFQFLFFVKAGVIAVCHAAHGIQIGMHTVFPSMKRAGGEILMAAYALLAADFTLYAGRSFVKGFGVPVFLDRNRRPVFVELALARMFLMITILQRLKIWLICQNNGGKQLNLQKRKQQNFYYCCCVVHVTPERKG